MQSVTMKPAAEPLRVLLVDDEALARLRLRTLVEDCTEPRAVVVGEAAQASEAMAWLRGSTACQGNTGTGRHDGASAVPAPGAEPPPRRCDVVLLDIHMPGRDGTQLADDLRRMSDPPAVVFVTAHATHALQAFDLEAVDYLTKPVRRERLQIALQRVAARLAPRASAASVANASPVSASADDASLLVSERGRIVRVPLSEVLYLKAELKYVTLRTPTHTYVLDEPLSDLEQRLGERFLRIHRNALVARPAVRALERRAMADSDDDGGPPGTECWAVQVAPVDEWLAVSRRQVGAVRDALAATGL
jgi:two-component system response regulator AlgR